MSPIKVVPGASIPVRFNGFDVGSFVDVMFFSDPIPGGQLAVDDLGQITGTTTIPSELSPGVHRVEFAGTNGSTPRVIRILIEIDGRPVGGEAYAAYFDGFEPGEDVTVTFGGLELYTVEANQDGGVVADVPMIDPAGPSQVVIEAVGRSSGVRVSREVSPVPSSAALWASGSGPAAVRVSGSSAITGAVHSEGGITASGSTSFAVGAEYVTTLTLSGAVTIAPAVQVAAGTPAPVADIAATVDSLTADMVIEGSPCATGRWRPRAEDLQVDVVRGRCGVDLRAANLDGPFAATIIAEGPIDVSGSGVLSTPSDARPSLVSVGDGAAIRVTGSGHSFGAMLSEGGAAISGSNHDVSGEIVTHGGVVVSGSHHNVRCGIYADSLRLSGGNSTFTACPPSSD